MKYVTHNEKDNINVNGTHLQGTIECSIHILDELFGEGGYGDGYKVDCEWEIEFEDGTVATIYNWKNGQNYCGINCIDMVDNTDWHVGGHNEKALLYVRKLVTDLALSK
jgi:hypothetical protein